MLQIHKTPKAGGDTLFANMYAAFDALSDTMKDLRSITAMQSLNIFIAVVIPTAVSVTQASRLKARSTLLSARIPFRAVNVSM